MATKMYGVYSVVPRKGKKDFWLRLGTMYVHGDAQGFNILLQGMPLPSAPGECKLVARELDDDENAREETEPDTAVPEARSKR